MLLAVLFSCFAFLANAQTLFVPNGLVGSSQFYGSPTLGVGIRNAWTPYHFQVWDGPNPSGIPNPWSGVGIQAGNNPQEVAQIHATKDTGLLIYARSQNSSIAQSGVLFGSGYGNQKTTFFGETFDFNVIDYTVLLNGQNQGARTLSIDNLNGQGYNLRVLGGIKAQKVTVTQNVWADYVFADDFKLRPLAEVATFIGKNKHLPDVPSQSEITTNGLDLGEMQKIHMQKIEELTLYLLEQEKRATEQDKRIQLLEQKLLQLSEKK